MDTSSLPAPQQFYQQVIQKYGWYSNYDDKNENGCWSLEIIVGLKEKWIILQSNEQDFKVAKTLLSSKAMELLQGDIAKQEAKELQSLADVFTEPLVIYDSADESTWKRFWETKPSVVGIDVEGNQRSPPVLVQVSTDEYTILEVPQDKLSDDLVRLLEDDSITKVFCDNGSHKDKKCLGMWKDDNNNIIDLTQPPIVDLEDLFGSLAGPVKAARGLSKIMAMCLELPPSTEASGAYSQVLNVRIGKPNSANQRMKSVGRFALIEQGKQKPLKGLKDLKHKEKQYAALDSWCTLQAYHRLKLLQHSDDRLKEPTTIVVEGNAIDATVEATKESGGHGGKPAVDKDSKEWLLEENKRLATELIEKDKHLKDAQRQIESLKNRLKSLQSKGNGNETKSNGGNQQGKNGGGRGGRGNNNRRNRKPNQNSNKGQEQPQQTK